jgi:hypothetical protein
MKKVKIKFGDGLLVSVPYKGGYVIWRVYVHGSIYSWQYEGGADNYRDKKYEKSHREYLNSKGLCNRVIRAAAASQNWDTMEFFVKARAYRYNQERLLRGGI